MPWIRPYVRSDGTAVKGHSRWAAGARREMTIFGLFALAVVGFGHSTTASTDGPGAVPRPQSTVHYPIHFDTTATLPNTRPQPTVSYPIRFPSPKGRR